ncbi:MAG: Rieske 2Fe-2S domain-containing protein [Pseudomonadota bacterium]
MSVKYEPVIWNTNKYLYDFILLIVVTLYIYAFLRLGADTQDLTRPHDNSVLRMQAFGTCAFFMLTFILCIGPLARIDSRFLPLLYNRRHFGVMTCLVATVHVSYVLGWYYAFSPTDPYVAVLGSNVDYTQWIGFPFEIFGIFALLVLLVLATTSHDFWLNFLTPPVWKSIHMLIYFAYASVVLHITLGYLQSNKDPTFAALTAASAFTVCVLHLIAGRKEHNKDKQADLHATDSDWIVVGKLGEIENYKALTVTLPQGDRVAVFRYDGKLSAVTNACAHQNGPLGEGRMLDGCITCPWHGFQYRPADGIAPPPYTEKIATYHLRLEQDTIYVNKHANTPGTYVRPLAFEESAKEVAS